MLAAQRGRAGNNPIKAGPFAAICFPGGVERLLRGGNCPGAGVDRLAIDRQDAVDQSCGGRRRFGGKYLGEVGMVRTNVGKVDGQGKAAADVQHGRLGQVVLGGDRFASGFF